MSNEKEETLSGKKPNEFIVNMKEKMALEKKKLAQMSGRKKYEYITEYYRWLIITIVCVVGISAWMLNHFVLNPPPDAYVNVSFYGPYVNDEALDKLTSDLNLYIVEDNEKFEAQSMAFYQREGDAEFNSTVSEKFFALLSISEFDILLVQKDYFPGAAADGLLLNLNELYTPAELTAFGDNVMQGKIIDKDYTTGVVNSMSENMPFGIGLADNAYFKGLGLNLDDWLICPVVNTKKPEIARQVMDYILK